jgi:exosortase
MNQAAPPAGRLSLPVLALGTGLAAAIVWATWPSLDFLSQRWANEPQYSHGYVVPIFALVILWFRRKDMPTQLSPTWWGLAFFGVGGALDLAGAYFGYSPLAGWALLPLLAGLALVVGGWGALRWSWPAILFLLFMVPPPFQVEIALAQPLQTVATIASTYALQTLGLPAVADGNIILINDLRLGVLEACNGLAMLITFFALSTAVAMIVRRPWYDRVVIFLSAIPIGLLMNIVRITVTGVLYVTVGGEIANKVFHDLAGWLMMPAALGVLWLELLLLTRLFVPVAPVPTPIPAPAIPF